MVEFEMIDTEKHCIWSNMLIDYLMFWTKREGW